jgi:hypothetical protein
VGDLVIVEADRGKDLGKVVNDSITLAEVDAFQKQQAERAGDAQASSPGGAGPGTGGTGKKEINPKMIYGKAQPQDAKYVVCHTFIFRFVANGEFFALASWLRKCRTSLRRCSYARARSARRSCRWRWWMLSISGTVSFYFVPSFLMIFTMCGIRDRRKLTFYFVAEKRIDFRELVRELFRYVSCVCGP